MNVEERESSNSNRARQREYWAGWDEHKARSVRPDATRPAAQQGWDAWSTWLVNRLDVDRANLLGRRLSRPRKSMRSANGEEPGVKLRKSGALMDAR